MAAPTTTTTTAAGGDTPPLRDAPLAAADAEAALALSAEAGWNQTAADWRLMIGLGEALGCFAGATGCSGGGDGGGSGGGGDRDRLVGSALLVPYPAGRLAWLSMVLVTAPERRRGIATRLVAACLERADRAGLTVGLDATPAGRPVYRQLGFRDAFGLHRLAAEAPAIPQIREPAIRPMRPDDLPAVAALDALAFGADRTPVLAYLRTARPECALVAESRSVGGALRGYAFVRHGRLAHHLGPLAADGPDLAAALAARVLAGLGGDRTVADVPDDQQAFLARLGDWGFRPLRPFTRMFRTEAAPPRVGDRARTFAIAGPELG